MIHPDCTVKSLVTVNDDMLRIVPALRVRLPAIFRLAAVAIFNEKFSNIILLLLVNPTQDRLPRGVIVPLDKIMLESTAE